MKKRNEIPPPMTANAPIITRMIVMAGVLFLVGTAGGRGDAETGGQIARSKSSKF
jgi:hypothetical protein